METNNELAVEERERGPTPWFELEIGFDPRERWTECPYYEECLDKAANEDWPGFTCWFCPYQENNREEN